MKTKNQILQRCRAALDQRRRFEKMAEPLQTWANKWSTQTLERWLNLDHLPLIEREKALVALALKATEEAGAAITAYDWRFRGEEHELFYRVARAQWEQRHKAQWRPAA